MVSASGGSGAASRSGLCLGFGVTVNAPYFFKSGVDAVDQLFENVVTGRIDDIDDGVRDRELFASTAENSSLLSWVRNP